MHNSTNEKKTAHEIENAYDTVTKWNSKGEERRRERERMRNNPRWKKIDEVTYRQQTSWIYNKRKKVMHLNGLYDFLWMVFHFTFINFHSSHSNFWNALRYVCIFNSLLYLPRKSIEAIHEIHRGEWLFSFSFYFHVCNSIPTVKLIVELMSN